MVGKGRGTYLKGIFLVILVLASFSYINYRALKIDNRYRKPFYDTLLQTIKTDTHLDMSDITSFSWDMMFIIRPYTPQQEMHKKVGTKWTTADSYMGYLVEKYFLGEYQLLADEIHKLVFMEDGKVILDIDLMRKEADFTQNEDMIAVEDAKFTVDKTRQHYFVVQCEESI